MIKQTYLNETNVRKYNENKMNFGFTHREIFRISRFLPLRSFSWCAADNLNVDRRNARELYRNSARFRAHLGEIIISRVTAETTRRMKRARVTPSSDSDGACTINLVSRIPRESRRFFSPDSLAFALAHDFRAHVAWWWKTDFGAINGGMLCRL